MAGEVQMLTLQEWAPGTGSLVGTMPYELLAREKEGDNLGFRVRAFTLPQNP